MSHNSLESIQKAMEDAVLYGAGWMVMKHNGQIEHIGPDRYLEAAETLAWAHERIQSLPKE